MSKADNTYEVVIACTIYVDAPTLQHAIEKAREMLWDSDEAPAETHPISAVRVKP